MSIRLCLCVQAALDLESVDYEGTMAAKLRLCRRIFDTVGHKSLQTQGFKVRAQQSTIDQSNQSINPLINQPFDQGPIKCSFRKRPAARLLIFITVGRKSLQTQACMVTEQCKIAAYGSGETRPANTTAHESLQTQVLKVQERCKHRQFSQILVKPLFPTAFHCCCRSGLLPASTGWCRTRLSASCGTSLALQSTGAGV
jgi:hypothetical protein